MQGELQGFDGFLFAELPGPQVYGLEWSFSDIVNCTVGRPGLTPIALCSASVALPPEP